MQKIKTSEVEEEIIKLQIVSVHHILHAHI